MSVTIAPLRHHGPGWKIEQPDGTDFVVWAPRPAETGRPARDDWQAAWTNHDGSDGDNRHGATFDDVVAVVAPYGRWFRTAARDAGLIQ